MSKEIRDAAEALIKLIESLTSDTQDGYLLRHTDAYKDLKDSLRPSREEIIIELEEYVRRSMFHDQVEYINYAIEELRK